MKPEFRLILEILHRTMWDKDVRERFLADPRRMIEGAGVTLGPEDRVIVHENKPGEYHLVVPEYINDVTVTPEDHPLLP
jgi:hypothetical protein